MTRRRKQVLLGVSLFVGIFAALEVGGRVYVHRARARLNDAARAARVPQRYDPVLGEYYRLSDDEFLLYEPKPGVYFDGALVINSKGYRGREFSDLPSPGTIRIVAVGDSCTFGTVIAAEPNYTERLEAILSREDPSHRYEVINGGVEGYNVYFAKRRLELSLKYRPAIVLVYIGWNDIYYRTPFGPNQPTLPMGGQRLVFRSYALRILGRLGFEARKRLGEVSRHDSAADPKELLLQTEEFYPAGYVEYLRDIIRTGRGAGAEVVVLTLPTIFGPGTEPEDLKRAHYPHFTRDPRLVRALTDNYNERIREVAAEENAVVADAVVWIDSAPGKGKLFADAYHMFPAGHQVLAEELARLLRERGILPAGEPAPSAKRPRSLPSTQPTR